VARNPLDSDRNSADSSLTRVADRRGVSVGPEMTNAGGGFGAGLRPGSTADERTCPGARDDAREVRYSTEGATFRRKRCPSGSFGSSPSTAERSRSTADPDRRVRQLNVPLAGAKE